MLDLKCGDKTHPLQLAPERVLSVLRPTAGEPGGTAAELVESALDNCREALSRFRPGEQVVIVTSDVTRPTGSDIYLPLIVSRLNAAGIGDRDIEIVIALGIHRKQTEAEHRRIV